MILGIGNDVVNIARIEAVLERHGDRFRSRIYTQGELALARRMADSAGMLAKRWAAKEACTKALGTGMTRGVALRDIEVKSKPGNPPVLELHGGALARLRKMLPPGCQPRIHLSMSDDRPSASAVVVIEAVPSNNGQPQRTAIHSNRG